MPVQPALDCSYPVGRDFRASSAPICSPTLHPHKRVSLIRRAEERCQEAKGKAKENKSPVSSDFSIACSSALFGCQVYRSPYARGRYRSTSTFLPRALQASLSEGVRPLPADPFSFGWDQGHQMEPWGSACTNTVSAAFTNCRSRGEEQVVFLVTNPFRQRLLVKRDFSLPRFLLPQRASRWRPRPRCRESKARSSLLTTTALL